MKKFLNPLLLMLSLLTLAGADSAKSPTELEKVLKESLPKAEQGDAEAQYKVGLAFYASCNDAEHFAKAIPWFRKAAEQDFGLAQFKLGVCYSRGEGVEKDLEQSVRWNRAAAKNSIPEAEFNMGTFYQKGEGVE